MENRIIQGFSCRTEDSDNVHVSVYLGGLVKRETVIRTRDDWSSFPDNMYQALLHGEYSLWTLVQ